VTTRFPTRRLHDVVVNVVTAWRVGQSLSQAFAAHPKVFSDIYVSLVAAGEASGSLDKALERIANQQEKDAAILSKIRGALIYPVIVLLVIVAVLVFMLTTVLPQVGGLYKDLHKDCRLLTQICLRFRALLRTFGFW
jgi:type II secretory pathway component PulF